MDATFVVPEWTAVSREQFVEFWDRVYEFPDTDVYEEEIGKPLTPERVRRLFLWKNGGKLPERTRASVEANFVQRIDEAKALPTATGAREFLERFDEGGAIFRIFWLHLWQPERHPMLDQHVYRAMSFIRTGGPGEIPSYDPKKIELYVEEYRPFLTRHFDGLDPRKVDRALWAFGKAIKALDAVGLSRARP